MPNLAEQWAMEEATTEWVRLILSVAMTTYNEKPEAERARYLKVVAGSLVRGIVDRARDVLDGKRPIKP